MVRRRVCRYASLRKGAGGQRDRTDPLSTRSARVRRWPSLVSLPACRRGLVHHSIAVYSRSAPLAGSNAYHRGTGPLIAQHHHLDPPRRPPLPYASAGPSFRYSISASPHSRGARGGLIEWLEERRASGIVGSISSLVRLRPKPHDRWTGRAGDFVYQTTILATGGRSRQVLRETGCSSTQNTTLPGSKQPFCSISSTAVREKSAAVSTSPLSFYSGLATNRKSSAGFA